MSGLVVPQSKAFEWLGRWWVVKVWAWAVTGGAWQVMRRAAAISRSFEVADDTECLAVGSVLIVSVPLADFEDRSAHHHQCNGSQETLEHVYFGISRRRDKGECIDIVVDVDGCLLFRRNCGEHWLLLHG